MRSARSRGSRARRVDRVNGGGPFDALEGGGLVGGDRIRFDTAAPDRARRQDAARGSDALVASRELRTECPLSRRKTCPDLAPCRRRAGRLSWHRRAGPSATLDKALFGCREMMPEPSRTRKPNRGNRGPGSMVSRCPPAARPRLAAGIRQVQPAYVAEPPPSPWGESGDGLGPSNAGRATAGSGRSGTLARQARQLRRCHGSQPIVDELALLFAALEVDVRHLS